MTDSAMYGIAKVHKANKALADLLAHLEETALMARAVSIAQTYHLDCATQIDKAVGLPLG